MSAASERGRTYESKISKIMRRRLGIDIKRDLQSGAGLHKADVRDRYNELPMLLECKNQDTLKLKEWWRDANNKANALQSPVVVFPMETNDGIEDLCVLRFTDLLQLVKEVADWKETAEDLRQSAPSHIPVRKLDAVGVHIDPRNSQAVVGKITSERIERGAASCKNGHLLSIGETRCLDKKCPYSRYARLRKGKK